MNWIDRITQAIKSDDIDHKRFERAACALLQPQYPGLSPVEGGTDLGRDADIYDLAQPAEGPGGRLLATTGDPLKNVTNGLNRMREEGLTAAYLVIACSQPVSAKTRQKLEQRCADAGLSTPHIFGQDRMVQLLAKDPDWTEELFGFRGRISALISAPLVSHDDETPLLGRDELVAQLRSAVEAGSDVLVVGVPGAGKSRVVRELTDATLLEPAGIAYLLDDLVLDNPRCVVVDDAHLHSDALMQLIALRRQEGLSFPVVAVAWPAEADAARSHLLAPVLIEAGLLRRDHMDEIVRAHGVTGVRARHLVLEQADGRPGWAITLSQTLIAGNGRHVASGAVLLDQVLRHVQSNADSAVTLDAVACLAALHSATIDDLGRISQLIGLPNAPLIDSLRALATDGLLTCESGNWRLQPGLGGALVSRWFFGQPEMRSWDSLTHAFPDRHHDLTTSMLNAAKSSSFNGLRQRIGQWVRTIPSPQQWDESTLRLVHTYATTSEDAANFAARGSNEILKHPRPLVTSPWGTTHDPLGDAAKKLLTRCVQQWFDADAVKGLLTLALADDRARHNNTDHPMRVLGDMTNHLGPDGESYFETRAMLLEISSAWVNEESDDNNNRVTVWAEAVAHALNPNLRGTWSDPSSFRSFQMADGIEPTTRITELVALWDDVVAQLESYPATLPIAATEHLFKLWEEWLRLARGISRGRSTPSDKQASEARRGAWRIYESMHPTLAARPGLALRAQRALDLAARWDVRPPQDVPSLPLDQDLILLVGRRDVVEGDAKTWLVTREEQLAELAGRLVGLGPGRGVARLGELEAEAQLMGGGSGAWRVSMQIARAVNPRQPWLTEAVNSKNQFLVSHLLSEMHRDGEPFDIVPIAQLLNDPLMRGTVISAVFDGPPTDLTQLVLDDLCAQDAAHIEGALLHRDAADETVHAVLQHPVPAIAATAALCFQMGTDHGMPLPPAWQQEWRNSFLASAEFRDSNSLTSFRQAEILKRLATDHPEICVDWFERVAQTEDLSYHELHDLHDVVRALPVDARRRVALLIPTAHRAFAELLLPLCEGQVSIAADLLADGFDSYHFLVALEGHLDAHSEALSPHLLADGVSPRDIARSLTGSRSWIGNESDDLARMIDWFTDLRTRQPQLAPVADAALPWLHADRERALAEEEREAIRGYG